MSIVEVFSLLGGVGLFLFGMTIMSSGLKNACGDNLQVILEHAPSVRSWERNRACRCEWTCTQDG